MKKTRLFAWKKNLLFPLTAAVLGGFAAGQAAAATLSDFGASAPTPGANDISQLSGSGSSNGDGMNFYDNNNPTPGQTFTTGGNASGYTLSSLAYEYVSGSGHSGSQKYYLYIYSVGAGAVLVTNYTATATIADGHWVQWTGLSVPLQPNATYAFTIHCSAGYEDLATVAGNAYAGGEIVEISTNGAVQVAEAVTTGATHGYDAAFDAGLALGGAMPVAASDVWSGGSTSDANLSDAANWSGSAPVQNSFLTFSGSTRTSPNNDLSGYTFGNITFAPATAASFTLGGNALTLGFPLQDTNGNLYGGGIANLATNPPLAAAVNAPVTLSAGNHVLGAGSGGQLTLAGAVTRPAGATVQFYTNGVVNLTTAGLATDGSSGGGILGGWAVIGTGNDAGNWATTNAGGNVVAYTGYTAESASFTSVAGGNFKETANNGTLKVTAESGSSYVDLNTLLCNPGTSHGETIEANTSSQPLRLGAEGAIMNIDGNSQTVTIGGGSSYSLTAGGNNANGAGELTLIQLGSGSAHLIINSVIQNNGSGAVTLNQLGSVNYNDANTHSGGTYFLYGEGYFNGGNSVNAPFGSGPIYVYPGARLDLGGDNTATIANSLYIAGFGSYEGGANNPAAIKGSYNGNFTGLITLLGSAQIDPNGGGSPNTCTFSGGFAGAGNLVIGGANVDTAGAATFGGNCSYSGDTIIDASANKNGGAGIIIASGKNNLLNNGGNLNLIGGSSGVAVLDLNGTTQTVNGLTNTSGTAANAVVKSSAAGGLLIAGNGNVTSAFGGILENGSGTLALAKTGSGTLTLTGTSTYTGDTAISNGTVALSGSGSIADSANISLAAGATLDVSALPGGFTLGGSQGLSAAGTGTTVGTSAATIRGGASQTISLGSQPVTLAYNGSQPALYISQGTLSLAGNAFTINGPALAAGANTAYTIIQQAGGSITGSGTYSASGTAIGSHIGTVTVSGINVNLNVDSAPAVGANVTNTVLAGGVWKISILSLSNAAAWSDPDGDAVSLSSVAASGNGTNVTTDGKYVYYQGLVNTNDSFDYVISDGVLTATGTVYLAVTTNQTQTAATTIGSPAQNGSGNPTFSGHCIPGYVLGVESETSLSGPWVEAGNVTVDADGAWNFTDTNQVHPSQIYYRLYYPDNPGNPPQ